MVNTYAADAVTLTYKGYTISGFADGTFIKVSKNSDSFSLTIGADGSGARVGKADKSGKLAATLLQTSASNDVLSGFLANDEIGRAGGGTLMLKDLLGRTLAFANIAWISKWPDIEFSKEAEGREWGFETDNLQVVVGGNT